MLIHSGSPPRWQIPKGSQKLQEDSGVYYRDQNSVRSPDYPTAPAVKAIFYHNPEYKPSSVDIFGCGNTLGSLLSFVRNEERTFRFGVERVGTTLFLVRKTNSPREVIEDVRGYGHSFPDANTTWDHDVAGSASHQRIIEYNFGGLHCLVRSECDGFLPNLVPGMTVPQSLPAQHIDNEGVPDNLGDALSSFGLGNQLASSSSNIIIRRAGNVIPQNLILDLKTRSTKVKDRVGTGVDDFLPRLWVNQTPNFILAFHEWGTFTPSNIHVKDITRLVSNWESNNADALHRLRDLLAKLIDTTSQEGRTQFEIRRIGTGPLEMWSEVREWSALPEDLKRRWQCADSAEGGIRSDADEKDTTSEKDESSDEDEGDDADYLRF